ncbi:Maf family protein [Thermodesulfobacteriota bacterium]
MELPVISNKNPLILASASPRRKDLLKQVNIPFIVFPSDIDENGGKGKPYEISTHLAEQKAAHAYKCKSDNQWVLGADTIVVKNSVIMGKPSSYDEANRMLRYLSGGDHEVITGFSIIDPSGGAAHTSRVSTIVKVKKLSQNEIDSYIKSNEPFGKAGGYAIQGIGAFMIKSIEGSYSNVVGLPLFALIDSLKKLKALNHFPL